MQDPEEIKTLTRMSEHDKRTMSEQLKAILAINAEAVSALGIGPTVFLEYLAQFLDLEVDADESSGPFAQDQVTDNMVALQVGKEELKSYLFKALTTVIRAAENVVKPVKGEDFKTQKLIRQNIMEQIKQYIRNPDLYRTAE